MAVAAVGDRDGLGRRGESAEKMEKEMGLKNNNTHAAA